MITAEALRAQVATELDAWNQQIRVDVDIDGCRLQVANEYTYMYVEYVAVPKPLRRGGYGAAILAALTKWADRCGLVLRLGVSTEYGTPARVLTRFYAGHGFQPSDRIGGMRRYPGGQP